MPAPTRVLSATNALAELDAVLVPDRLMRFQTKLLYTYSLLIVLLVAILAVLFYGYSAGVFERNAIGTYDLLCTKLGQQIDNVLRPMDLISTNLISDAPFKSALASLGSPDRWNPGNSFFTTEAMQTIRSLLSTYSIYKNFYAVVVFNKRGDFFSSNFMDHSAVFISPDGIAGLPWIRRATLAAGRSVVVSPYADTWRKIGQAVVYGRARIVPGLRDDLGYIEVLNRYEDLEPILSIPGKEFVRILVLQSDGEPFYVSEQLPAALIEYYRVTSTHPDRAAGFRRNPLTRQEEFVSASTSSYSGLTMIVALDRRILLAPLRFVRSISLAVGLLIVLFSVAYTWVSSRQLTRPLKLIQGRIEKTDLSNLPFGSPIEHPNDEIVALDQSFQNLTMRLDDAIRHELDSRTLWMQARLDSLQAQVNPHFINNILTVIANRGLESGDEVIGRMCNGVASMLRYSTSTQERSATIEQELEHVSTYLFLMKQRLEELQYRVAAEPAVLKARVPKIVLQQIVENSINHGYQRIQKPISVGIHAFVSENRWVVEMTDDGEGFAPLRLEELNQRIRGVERGLRAGTEGLGLGFGGLGLLSTYSRLFLFYRGDILWSIGNGEAGGARVVVGGPLSFDSREALVAEAVDRRG
jgi:two-component system sensor histidine kinase YesM